MRRYHILISLHRKGKLSVSNPTPADNNNSDFVPTSLFQHLPAQKANPTARRNAIFNFSGKDYRFGPIRIDWTDFEDMNKQAHIAIGGKEKDSKGRGPATATFVPHTRTKSGSTNLPEGTVHIFRESSTPTPLDKELEADVSSTTVKTSESDGLMLGVLAVPAWMTPSEFLAFVAPAVDSMAHLRIIRDSAPNRSIVVIKFKGAAEAAEFAEAYNGKPFNSTEPEICHVVNVVSVEISPDDSVSPAITHLASTQGSIYELPTCPVCLERMDSAVTGLVTVPCSHTFHCMCLSKWGDSRCPVCRYSQNLLSSHPTSSNTTRSSLPIPFANSSTPTLSSCADCSSTTNLWICLICGNIGCGRYGRAHAQAHYQFTTHLYALELETQRVWDYAGDGYVHRLIQNKADGKLVELPSAASSMGMGASPRDGGLGPSPADALSAEKIEAIGIEYSYLLTSQLDSQRSHYEEQSMELKAQVEELRQLIEHLGQEFQKEKTDFREQEAKRRREDEMRMVGLEKDKSKAEKKAEKLSELARTLEKELKEERAVAEGLMKNLGKMKEKVEQSDKEKKDLTVKIADLEEQVRDVMFFLEAKTKIEQGSGVEAEAAGGSIEMPIPVHTSNTSKKKKPRKG